MLVCAFLAILPENAPALPGCHIHELTGILCPGCGSTRALRALLHGEWQQSFRQNILLVPGMVWLVILCVLSRNDNIQRHLLRWGGVILLIYTILRNIPSPMLDFLRPIP